MSVVPHGQKTKKKADSLLSVSTPFSHLFHVLHSFLFVRLCVCVCVRVAAVKLGSSLSQFVACKCLTSYLLLNSSFSIFCSNFLSFAGSFFFFFLSLSASAPNHEAAVFCYLDTASAQSLVGPCNHFALLCLHAYFLKAFWLLVFASLLANLLLLVKIWLQHHFASNILTASRNTLLHFLQLPLAQAYSRIWELDK